METIPVPLAVKLLIESHKERMEQSLKNITDSNLELMQMLNLLPSDGWRLDLDNLRYVRIQTTKPDELTSDE
jgi:hypothetical protein